MFPERPVLRSLGTLFKIDGPHNPEVVGSNPAPATRKKNNHRQVVVLFCVSEAAFDLWAPGYEPEGRIPEGTFASAASGRRSEQKGVAAVEILRSKQRAKNFGHRNRSSVQIRLPQPDKNSSTERWASFSLLSADLPAILQPKHKVVRSTSWECFLLTSKDFL